MAEIFISYAREERRKVEPFVTLLTQQGWDVWWDREIGPGVNFEKTIDKEISNAKCVVVFWSKDSIESDWVLAEAGEGLERGILIPVMLEEVRVPLIFRSTQSSMLLGWPEQQNVAELERVLAAIGELLERPVAAEMTLPAINKVKRFRLPATLVAGVVAILLAAVFLQDLRKSVEHQPPVPIPELTNEVAKKEITTLAVLPFNSEQERTLSGDLSFEIAEKLKLSRDIHVISDSHLQIHLNHPNKIDLGARYVVNGVIRGQADHQNITVSLFDHNKAATLWTETFDAQAGQLLATTNRIANRVATTFQGSLDLPETAAITAEGYTLYLQAQTQLRDPDDATALIQTSELYSDLVDRYPKFAEAYVGLCNVNLALYRELNDTEYFEAAERSCYRANTLNTDNSNVHSAIGKLYMSAGRYEPALQSLNKAIQLSPNSTSVLRNLATVYIYQRRNSEAEAVLVRAIELEPSFWGTYSQLGGFYYNLGNYEKAAENYLTARALVFNNPRVLTNLGAAYFLLEDFERAVESWQQSNAIKPAAATYSNLGSALFFKHEFQQALEAYDKALELKQEDDQLWAHSGEARQQLGLEYESYFSRALELAKDRLTINPNDGETLSKLATYYSAIAREEEAIEHITRALDVLKDDVYTVYDAAVTYSRLNMQDKKAYYLTRLQELGYSRSLIERDANF